MQSLCTLRNHCRQWPRNTRYQADATPYLGRTFTGWIAPACGWRTYSITSSARASSVRRHVEAERLGGLEVDDQLELGRVLHRQVARLLALEDAVDIAGGAPENVQGVRRIRHQAALHDRLPIRMDGGDGVLRDRRQDRLTMRHGERVRGNDETTRRSRGELPHLAFNLGGGGYGSPRDCRWENPFIRRERLQIIIVVCAGQRMNQEG